MGKPSKSIGALVRQYWVVVSFPTFTVSTIYCDLRRTREWKKHLAEVGQQNTIAN